MTDALLCVGAFAGVAFALYQRPREVREIGAALGSLMAALMVPFAAGLALLAGHAPPKRRHGRHKPPPPPTAPPRAGLTLGQTLERLYIDEDVISGAQYATLYGAAFDGHVLGRMLPAGADVDAVLDAVTTPQTRQEAFDEGAAQRLREYEARPYHSFTTQAAAVAQVPPHRFGPVLGKTGDVMRMLAGETIEQAEWRSGRRITETHEVRMGAAGSHVLAKLGPAVFPAPRPFIDLCDCRGVAGDCGPCTNACRAPGAPRDPTNVERA